MASKTEIKLFIEEIAEIAKEESKERILPSICIAQACIESAYGTAPKMVKANALFGIKVGKNKVHFGTAWKDKAYSTKTQECYDGKTYTQITDMFRAYDTVRESVQDYYDMLSTCDRYKKAVGETSPLKCITAIKNGGYATSPSYVDIVMGVVKKYNLTQYDAYPTLQYGSTGEAVRRLQTVLYRLCLLTTINDIDGIYGKNTQEAVKKYQTHKGLPIDGITGPYTWGALKKERV